VIPLFVTAERCYTGEELRPQIIATLLGKPVDDDAILAFIGPARVEASALVDMDDRIMARTIRADEMLHFIVELFGYGLFQTVLFQRWLVEVVVSRIHYLGQNEDAWVESRGDDIMVEFSDRPTGKLSVSIATTSAVGGLIHLGLNGRNDGTPERVDTACLRELGIDPKVMGIDVIHQVAERCKNMMAATCKVLPR
jgi:hypothetical protein